MKVICPTQNKYTVDFKKITNLITKKLDIKENYMFEVNFLNDKNMKIMNNKYRKINKTTDVISFALHDFKKFKTDLLGEIFIGIDTAKKDAKKLKISLQKEINLLFIHGLLHLLGYDHNNKKKEKIMFKLQNEILEYA